MSKPKFSIKTFIIVNNRLSYIYAYCSGSSHPYQIFNKNGTRYSVRARDLQEITIKELVTELLIKEDPRINFYREYQRLQRLIKRNRLSTPYPIYIRSYAKK